MSKSYKIIIDKQGVAELAQHISNSSIIAYDIETDSLNPRSGKIIGFSVSGDVGVGYYLPTKVWNASTQTLDDQFIEGRNCDEIAHKLISMLKGKKLVMHNGSFDIRFTKCYYGIDLCDDLYCDTMLLRHTLKEDGPFGLKDTAIELQNELGLDAEKEANQEQIELKESIKNNGGSTTKDNYEIFKADLDILGKYAAADTDLTLRIFTYYVPKLREEELYDFFFTDEVMPLYRTVTIDMEEKGTQLDLDLIKKVKLEIQEDLDRLQKEVVEELMKLPETKQWIMTKATENYPPSKRGSYAHKLIELRGYDLPKNEKGQYSVSSKNIQLIPDEQLKEFFATGNDLYLDQKEAMKVSLELMKEQEGDYININSKKQLSEICFDYLKIKPISQTRKGNDQFNDDLIDSLAKTHDWAKKLKDYNKLTKINSAYIDRFLENHENGRYYFYFKQHGTVSGRYSSDCQQIPRVLEEGEASELVLRYNNILRSFIKAESDRRLIICDQSSLEPRVFASVSDDPNLINVFLDNEDLYSRVAIQAFKLQGLSAKKEDPNYVKKMRPELRQRAKAIALAIPYGAGAYQIGQSLNIDFKAAQALIDSYLEGFPNLKQWMDDSKLRAQTFGYVKTKMGRTRHLDRVKAIYEVFEDGLLDYRVFKKLESGMDAARKQKLVSLKLEYKNGINNSRNFQIQGLAASIMNRSAIRIHKEFKEKGIDARIMLQIHDEFVINSSLKDVEAASEIVKRCMETTVDIPTGLVAEPNVALNFGEGHV